MPEIFRMVMEDGKKEAWLEMAQKLLQRGISIEAIAEDSGLTVEEIREFQKECVAIS